MKKKEAKNKKKLFSGDLEKAAGGALKRSSNRSKKTLAADKGLAAL